MQNINLSDRLPIPDRMKSLPQQNGYVVPWFVAEVDGKYDFRVIDPAKFKPALQRRLCWLCGQKLGAYLAFPIGPMCAINRNISEPPSHRDCAEYAIKVCPFLAQRQDERRETNLPDHVEVGGISIKPQPGAIGLWITKLFHPYKDNKGKWLFGLGDPIEVLWFKEGRSATRDEVMESIESGYPFLLELATLEGAVRDLEKMRDRALELLPQDHLRNS